MVITRQHQNPLVGLRITGKLIQQRIKLRVIQQRNGFLISRRQTIKRFLELMWVLLNKAVSDFANAIVETVSGVEIATVTVAEGLMKRSR
ncbi:Uncharacterised protein [Citrobacter amalonaticus]|nr:Uncharacterised protein [Citrobacter amalonaticus]